MLVSRLTFRLTEAYSRPQVCLALATGYGACHFSCPHKNESKVGLVQVAHTHTHTHIPSGIRIMVQKENHAKEEEQNGLGFSSVQFV